MTAASPPDLDTPPLWRISSFGRQRVPAGHHYWWQNASRQPHGRVVVQATLQGSIQYHEPHAERTVNPGDVMVFVYGEPTAYGQPDGPVPKLYRCHWACLEGAGLFEHIHAFRERFGAIRSLGLKHPLLDELDQLIALAAPSDPAAATPPTYIATAVHAFLMRLFDEAEQRRMQQLSPVQRAVDFIARQPHLVPNLDTTAHRFGCSREHLSRLFRQQLGQPPNTYLNTRKTQRAIRLLRYTDLPLADVAAQAGFTSTKTMARHIRRVANTTPSGVRTAASA